MLKHIGWAMLAVAGVFYLLGLVAAMILSFPAGLIGLLVIGGMGLLFVQALLDRLNNTEDHYYSKNVKR